MGFSHIRGLENIVSADNASFDGTERDGAMTTAGQLWIGATALPHVRLGTLTAGAGITIINGDGSITIASSNGGFTWFNEAISYLATGNHGYRSTAAVTGTLPPAGGADGTTIKFQATTSAIHTIVPLTTDVIQLGNKTSTNGAGSGSVASTAKGDTLELVYDASVGVWFAQSIIGNWTVV